MIRDFPDWFTGGYAELNFRKYLTFLSGLPNLHFLQIGAYAGDASIWLSENILTHASSTLTDVDTWEGSPQETIHSTIDFKKIQQYYTSRRLAKTRSFHMTSDNFFHQNKNVFDFIYIDGSHTRKQTLRDAVNAEYALKEGGILAFDDYQWMNPMHPRDRPKPAIDSFLICYEKDFEVINIGLQVWLRKLESK